MFLWRVTGAAEFSAPQIPIRMEGSDTDMEDSFPHEEKIGKSISRAPMHGKRQSFPRFPMLPSSRRVSSKKTRNFKRQRHHVVADDFGVPFPHAAGALEFRGRRGGNRAARG